MTLRFGPLATNDLTALVQGLLRQGAELAFIGRDALGNVQTHLLTAELPPGSPERALASTGTLPGAVGYANLSEGAVRARQALCGREGLRPAGPDAWNPAEAADRRWCR